MNQNVKLNTSFEEFSREFIKYLLADKDSNFLSKKMGYKFNIVRRWIIGTRIIKWKEFLQFVDALEINNQRFFKVTLGVVLLDKKDQENLFKFLREQWSHISTANLAKMLATDVSVLNKYINGSRAPSLAIVLTLLSHRVGYFEGFILDHTEGKQHPWEYLTENYKKQSDLLNYPAADLVFASLELEEYKQLTSHSSVFLSKKIKISPKEVDHILTLLVRQNIIAYKNNKFVRVLDHITATGASIETTKANIIYMQKKIIDVLENHVDGPISKGEFSTLQTHTVFHVSKNALQKIYTLIKNSNADIINVLENENQPPYVDVRVLLTSFFSASDFETPAE